MLKFKNILRSRINEISLQLLSLQEELEHIEYEKQSLIEQNRVMRFFSKEKINQLFEKMKSAESKISFLEQQMQFLKQLILSFDETCLSVPIDLVSLLEVLESLTNDLSKEFLLRLFGMAANAHSRLSTKTKYKAICKENLFVDWAQYFTREGELLENKDKDLFASALDKLAAKMSVPFTLKSFFEEQQEAFKALVLEESGVEASCKNDSYLQLSHYYDNYQLRRLPEDKNRFAMLLNECGIEQIEQRYIWDLILAQETLNQKKQLSLLLPKDVYAVYLKIKEQIDTIGTDNYAKLQQLEELFGLFLSDDSLKRKVYEQEIKDIISSLNPEMSTTKEEKRTHLVFLSDKDKSCLEQDLEGIDKGLRHYFVPLLNCKISSTNRKHFRKVITDEGFPFKMWLAYNRVAAIFIIEVMPNYFIVVGGSVHNFAYDDMIKRVIASQTEISELVRLIKDETTRNDLLENHSKIKANVVGLISKENSLERKLYESVKIVV